MLNLPSEAMPHASSCLCGSAFAIRQPTLSSVKMYVGLSASSPNLRRIVVAELVGLVRISRYVGDISRWLGIV